jgi:hypothetical protein
MTVLLVNTLQTGSLRVLPALLVLILLPRVAFQFHPVCQLVKLVISLLH